MLMSAAVGNSSRTNFPLMLREAPRITYTQTIFIGNPLSFVSLTSRFFLILKRNKWFGSFDSSRDMEWNKPNHWHNPKSTQQFMSVIQYMIDTAVSQASA